MGAGYGIPEQQMRFEQLFTVDHPNASPNAHEDPTASLRYFSPTASMAEIVSRELTEVSICGRVMEVAENGLSAVLLSDGRLVQADFPHMPGPTGGDIVGCRGRLRHTDSAAHLDVGQWDDADAYAASGSL